MPNDTTGNVPQGRPVEVPQKAGGGASKHSEGDCGADAEVSATDSNRAAVSAFSASRFEAATRELTRRALQEHPEMLPETVARHYTSLATTALQLHARIAARRAGATGMDESIAHCLAQLRQCHIIDFGVEPDWANALNPYTGEVSALAMMKNAENGHATFPRGMGETVNRPSKAQHI